MTDLDVLVVGAGHLAFALMHYREFEKEGIRIVAAFDIDPAKFDGGAQIPVLSMDELKEFVASNAIRVGVLAVPDVAAQRAADTMFAAGIRGILNFSPIRLKVPDDCAVNNINLEVEFENLLYFVKLLGERKEGPA
jgi:redox-sensing transcriptional repressor